MKRREGFPQWSFRVDLQHVMLQLDTLCGQSPREKALPVSIFKHYHCHDFIRFHIIVIWFHRILDLPRTHQKGGAEGTSPGSSAHCPPGYRQAGVPLSSIFVTNSRGLIWRSDATGNFRNEEQKQFAQAVHHGPFSWWKHGDFLVFFAFWGRLG